MSVNRKGSRKKPFKIFNCKVLPLLHNKKFPSPPQITVTYATIIKLLTQLCLMVYMSTICTENKIGNL